MSRTRVYFVFTFESALNFFRIGKCFRLRSYISAGNCLFTYAPVRFMLKAIPAFLMVSLLRNFSTVATIGLLEFCRFGPVFNLGRRANCMSAILISLFMFIVRS